VRKFARYLIVEHKSCLPEPGVIAGWTCPPASIAPDDGFESVGAAAERSGVSGRKPAARASDGGPAQPAAALPSSYTAHPSFAIGTILLGDFKAAAV
jgi:hypothetical protein